MRYAKPSYFDDFCCIARECPASCCEGWQIVIDDTSLKTYWERGGSLGNRLKNSIDWEEGVFCQYEGRCAFLNEENLCDIQKEAGEELLCHTCRTYPRHTEEFENVREYSLSLSCPEAARIMISRQEPVTFTEWESEEEELFEEGFDFLLYTHLLDARGVLLKTIWNRKLSMEKRMENCLWFAGKFQGYLEEGDYSALETCMESCKEQGAKKPESGNQSERKERFRRRTEELEVLKGLERLRPEWEILLSKAEQVLYAKGSESYSKIYGEFQQTYGYESKEKGQWNIWMEQLAVFFIYTYFCGAVYDDAVYSKVRFAEFSLTWIQEFLMAEWAADGKIPTMEAVISMAYRYAREIEHSDRNLNQLEDWFWDITHLEESFREDFS